MTANSLIIALPAAPRRLRRDEWLALGPSLLYFFLAPIPQARLVRIGPVSMVVFLGAMGILSLLLMRQGRGRIFELRSWHMPTCILFISFAIGLVLAPDRAYAGTLRNLALFAIPLSIISLMPRRGRFLRASAVAGLSGLCTAAIFQLVVELSAGPSSGAYFDNTLSIMIHRQRDWETAALMGIQGVSGSIAMGIGAACCCALMLTARSVLQILGWACLAVLMMIGQSRGGYLVPTLVGLSGIGVAILAAGAVRWGAWFRRTAVATAFLVLFGFWALPYFESSRTLHRIEVIEAFGVLGDTSIRNRFEHLNRSLDVFLDNPFFGIGFQERSFDRESPIGEHSSLVDVPAQLGMLGFVGYFGLILIPLSRAALFMTRKGLAPMERPVALAAFVGLSAFFVSAVLDPVFLVSVLNETFLVLAGLSLTLRTIPEALGPDRLFELTPVAPAGHPLN